MKISKIRGKPQFYEGWINPRTDPLAASLIENAYDAFEASEEALEVERYRVLSEALVEMLSYFVRGNTNLAGYDATVGRRVIAAVWAINPEYFDGESLATLARQKGIGTSRAWLSKLAVDFSDRFGVANRAMATKRARGSFSDARNKSVKRSRKDGRGSKKGNTRPKGESAVAKRLTRLK